MDWWAMHVCVYTTHAIPNKSRLGEGLGAFLTRGNSHPLSCRTSKIVSRTTYFSSAAARRSSAGRSSSHETLWKFLKKIKNETTLWLSDLTSGCLSEEAENANSKGHIYVPLCALQCYLCNSQAVEAARVPINRRADKKAVVHTYNRTSVTWPKPRIKSFLVFTCPILN